ncbi:MAG: hypothetical protein LC808_22760 [Actinobacteria bacterium]|nr:hypothetical protein [Actinomycetota bacterium]
MASASELRPGGETTVSVTLFIAGYFADPAVQRSAEGFGLCIDEPVSVVGPRVFREGTAYCLPVVVPS